jgi:sarcosine oxidase/L-pipecolate oxidase
VLTPTSCRSGVLVLGDADATYAEQAYLNDANIAHARLQKLDSGAVDSITNKNIFPPQIKLGPLLRSSPGSCHGYLNHDGGWANATQGISLLMSKVVALGGNIITGKCVESLVRSAEEVGDTAGTPQRISGVRCTDGTVYHADLVILSTGSWTSSAFPELQLQEQCLATGYVAP